MTYRKLERITLWFLTIIMLFMFCVAEWSSNSNADFGIDLLNTMTDTEKQYERIIKDYRNQVEDLKVENAELKTKIKELEETK